MFETVFIIVLAAFAAGGIWAFAVSKRLKKKESKRMQWFPVLNSVSGTAAPEPTQDRITSRKITTSPIRIRMDRSLKLCSPIRVTMYSGKATESGSDIFLTGRIIPYW